jgi:DNA-binding NtrC family response regulator
MPDSVLLIDDDVDVLRSVGQVFERAGYEVSRELNAESGLAAYDRLHPEVVVLDLHLPGMNGLDALVRFRERNAAVILLTGHSDVSTAVEAMQRGAENFLSKPVDMSHLLAAVARVADKVRLRRLNELLLLRSTPGEGLDSLGESPAMKDLGRQIGLIALSERTPVLLRGETGVGKRWMAAMIHSLSPRASGPLVEVQIWGKTPAGLDAELFGKPASGVPAWWKPRRAARSSCRRSVTFRRSCSRNCSGCSRPGASGVSAACANSRRTSASSPPRAGISMRWSRPAASVRTSPTG